MSQLLVSLCYPALKLLHGSVGGQLPVVEILLEAFVPQLQFLDVLVPLVHGELCAQQCVLQLHIPDHLRALTLVTGFFKCSCAKNHVSLNGDFCACVNFCVEKWLCFTRVRVLLSGNSGASECQGGKPQVESRTRAIEELIISLEVGLHS